MKKFLIFTFIVLISVSNYAQNKEKPLNIYIEGFGRLQKVEQNQEATIFYFEKMVVEAGKPFSMPNNLKVRNQMSNHFYSLIKVENAPNSEILSQKNAIYQYQLFFEPVDKRSTSLQMINDEKELSLGKPFQTLSRFFYLNEEEETKKNFNKTFFFRHFS